MKKISLLCALLLLISCGTKKDVTIIKQPLFEVIKQDQFNGAQIKFNELITEKQEFQLLLSDPELKKVLKPSDIETANFVILHMGEKNSGGYSITVVDAKESVDSITLVVSEESPKGMATAVMTYPMAIIKVYSKKKIIINYKCAKRWSVLLLVILNA
jgi:hypothetical protein